MTEDSVTALRASALLFGDADSAAQVLATLRANNVVPSLAAHVAQLPGDMQLAIHEESARLSTGLFEVTTLTLLLQGWREHEALQDAARRTLAAPGATATVELADHVVRQEYRPSLDIHVDAWPPVTIMFTVTIEFDIKALVAVVREGRLSALRSGGCDVTATLAVQGIDAVRRDTHLDLALVVPLGDGFALLDAEDEVALAPAETPGRAVPRTDVPKATPHRN